MLDTLVIRAVNPPVMQSTKYNKIIWMFIAEAIVCTVMYLK